MARQLQTWTETSDAPDPAHLNLVLQEPTTPLPLDWYRSNPRLAMDRLAKFDGNPEYTPYYDEGDL